MLNLNIGIGTAAIGRPQYINIRTDSSVPTSAVETFSKEDFKAAGRIVLDTAYNKGVRYFDTAPGYGLAEELVLEWVNSKQDASIEVATKWGYEYVANFDPTATVHEVKDHSVAQLLKQWEVSKQLLPYLTTLQIHSATFDTGVLDDQKVLQQLSIIKAEYGIRIGLTTTGDNQVAVLNKALAITVNELPLFEAFQVTYNILDQSLIEVVNTIHTEGHRIIIKEALANGRMFPNKRYPNYSNLYTALQAMAEKYSVGIDALALNFCLVTVQPYAVLSGASTAQQLHENLQAESFVLSECDVEYLKSFAIEPVEYWEERKGLVWN